MCQRSIEGFVWSHVDSVVDQLEVKVYAFLGVSLSGVSIVSDLFLRGEEALEHGA